MELGGAGVGGAGGGTGAGGGIGAGIEGGGGGAVQDQARLLGAGVLVEVEEVVKAWRGVMLGELGGVL